MSKVRCPACRDTECCGAQPALRERELRLNEQEVSERLRMQVAVTEAVLGRVRDECDRRTSGLVEAFESLERIRNIMRSK